MIDYEQIHRQIKTSEKAIREYKKQISNFESIIQGAMKGATDDEKKQCLKLQMLLNNVIQLASQGKTDEVETLIKEFKHGSNNRK